MAQQLGVHFALTKDLSSWHPTLEGSQKLQLQCSLIQVNDQIIVTEFSFTHILLPTQSHCVFSDCIL